MNESLEFYMVAQELARWVHMSNDDIYLFERRSDRKVFAVSLGLGKESNLLVCTTTAESHKYALGWVLADDNGKPIIADRTSIIDWQTHSQKELIDWFQCADYAYFNPDTNTDECSFYSLDKKITKNNIFEVAYNAGYDAMGIIRGQDAYDVLLTVELLRWADLTPQIEY